MKTITSILLLSSMFIALGASAQETETRKVPAFDKLEIGGSFDAVLRQGNETSVKIIAENIDTKKIRTETDGNTLKVSLENGNYHNIRIKVEVTYESLVALSKSGSGDLTCESDLSSSNGFDLSSNGSGNVKIKGTIKGGQVSIDRSGSGDMKLGGLQAETVHMNFSGSGNFDVDNGNAKTQTIHLNGSGNVSAYGLKTETCYAAISGSGDIEVNVSNSIDADITGSGNIEYTGNAEVKKIEVHGSGKINKKG
jgi:hypothetical protein